MNEAGKDIKRILDIEREMSARIAGARISADKRINQAREQSDKIKAGFTEKLAEYEKHKTEEYELLKRNLAEEKDKTAEQIRVQLKNKLDKEHGRLTQIALGRILPYGN